MTTKLKEMSIELVTNVNEDGSVETQEYKTPTFIPFSKLMKATKKLEALEDKSEMEAMDEMFEVICDLYNNQFTVKQLTDGLHAPDAVRIIQENIEFISTGEIPKNE
jgi:hypothetical protein